MQSKQREALMKCVLEGPSRSMLAIIWRSDDLWTIRLAVRVLPNIPGRWNEKFNSAIKQMSG